MADLAMTLRAPAREMAPVYVGPREWNSRVPRREKTSP